MSEYDNSPDEQSEHIDHRITNSGNHDSDANQAHQSTSSSAIEALDFEAPGEPSADPRPAQPVSPNAIPIGLATAKNAPWWHSQLNLMICVFGLLVVAALLFILLLPPPDVESIAGNSTAVTDQDAQSPLLEDSPFDEKRLAQARTDSQDILSDLLVTKKALEQKEVRQWAPQKFADALAKAEQGDDVYKQQKFSQAIDFYKASLSELNALDDRVPQILKARIEAGLLAIKAGKSALAKDNFQGALRLDQNSIDALNGLERANKLDDVIELVRAGALAEESFKTSDKLTDLQTAEQKYNEALELDKLTTDAQQGLQRVAQASEDKRFRLAMTDGFNALFAKRYGSAKSAFSKALQIKPSDSTASGAYKQSLAADKSSSLSGILGTAKALEKAENWASALSNYQVVLQRDPNQVSAKLGQIRAKARGDLDNKIVEILKDPLELARGTQRERATKLLADAKAIVQQGPRLKSQIEQIESALSTADVNIKVTLFSDGVSDIVLKKAGAKAIDLGKFSSKNMSLKPGRYVLSGSRLGYRDVRREVELVPKGNGVQSFTVRCDTPINKSA